jgi:hypothetical protein
MRAGLCPFLEYNPVMDRQELLYTDIHKEVYYEYANRAHVF